jgi:hypothetical protein
MLSLFKVDWHNLSRHLFPACTDIDKRIIAQWTWVTLYRQANDDCRESPIPRKPRKDYVNRILCATNRVDSYLYHTCSSTLECSIACACKDGSKSNIPCCALLARQVRGNICNIREYPTQMLRATRDVTFGLICTFYPYIESSSRRDGVTWSRSQ